MAVTVRIPTTLRKLAAGADHVTLEASTVGAVFDQMKAHHPDLAAQLLDENGKVRRFVNIFANDEDIRFLDNLDTPLNDGDEVMLVPATAGG
ncbi:MAG: molybdopterin synthase sulfur carrier subunit [Bradymonadia bacterium]|jgi:molybdopterin synthase sulfur carrier subunit